MRSQIGAMLIALSHKVSDELPFHLAFGLIATDLLDFVVFIQYDKVIGFGDGGGLGCHGYSLNICTIIITLVLNSLIAQSCSVSIFYRLPLH